jgi:hypothetical protein
MQSASTKRLWQAMKKFYYHHHHPCLVSCHHDYLGAAAVAEGLNL